MVPAAREYAIWRELRRKLEGAQISASALDHAAGISRCVQTGIGPIMALTTWRKLLSVLELEAADEEDVLANIAQLRSLCDAADTEAFLPLSDEQMSDQRLPALILQLNSVVQASVAKAVSDGVLDITDLRPQASWDRIGRYIRFSNGNDVGAWVGVHFELWRKHGGTPLWLVFTPGEFSRSLEVRALIDPWAMRSGVRSVFEDHNVAVGIDLPTGEGKGRVVHSVAGFFREVGEVLSALPDEGQDTS